MTVRAQLKGISEKDYWVYGISERDFEHTVRLAQELINARVEQLDKYEKLIRENSPDTADDILDDVVYYRYTDEQFLWTFCLWRLQGLIEAIITYKLLELTEKKRSRGFKSKLEALRKAGYTVSDEEYGKLLDWANLRNALSHAPPEEFRPGPLNESDVIEYQKFLEMLFHRWGAEKQSHIVVTDSVTKTPHKK